MPERPLSFDLLPDLVGFQLRMAQVAIFRDFSADIGELGITPGLFGVLVLIDANPDLKQSDLARAAQLDRSTVVTVIDNLERRCLVERRTSPTDRRSNALRLTPAGRRLLRTLKKRVTAHEARLTARLTVAERAELVRLLKEIFPDQR